MGADYRSHNSTTYASRTDTTVTAPSGIADGDVLILMLMLAAASPPTPTLPSGFTLLTGYPSTVGDGSFNIALRVAYKVASSESGDYTSTHTSCSSQGAVVCVSGGDTGSAPAATLGTGTAGVSTAPGLTTAANDALVLFLGESWDGYGAAVPPVGTTPTFTERVDNGEMYVATGVMGTAGATGDKTQANGNVGVGPWQAGLVAVEAAGGVAAVTGSMLLLGVGN